MRTILHILTKPQDELAQQLIDSQRALAETKVEVVALEGEPDYAALVDQIFAADSVQVW